MEYVLLNSKTPSSSYESIYSIVVFDFTSQLPQIFISFVFDWILEGDEGKESWIERNNFLNTNRNKKLDYSGFLYLLHLVVLI